MFEGLLSYEIMLIILGLIMFLSCLCIFIVKSIKTNIPKTLIPYFLLALICIVYPGIQKITWENNKLSIEKNAQEIISKTGNQKPEDILVFNKSIDDLENSRRSFKDPKFMSSIAEAKFKMGDVNGGEIYLKRALEINPEFKNARILRDRYISQPNNPQKPDLILSNVEIRVKNPPYHSGELLPLCCTIEPQFYSEPYKYRVFIDGNLFQEVDNPANTFGGCVQWQAITGHHTIMMVVDPLNVVSEANESNNQQSLIVDVQ